MMPVHLCVLQGFCGGGGCVGVFACVCGGGRQTTWCVYNDTTDDCDEDDDAITTHTHTHTHTYTHTHLVVEIVGILCQHHHHPLSPIVCHQPAHTTRARPMHTIGAPTPVPALQIQSPMRCYHTVCAHRGHPTAVWQCCPPWHACHGRVRA